MTTMMKYISVGVARLAAAVAVALACCTIVFPIAYAYAQEEDHPTDVYLLVAPYLTWDAIDSEYTPTLYQLVKNHACTNVITESKADIEYLETYPGFHYQRMNATKAREVDARAKEIYDSLKPGDSFIITSSPSLAKIDSYELPGYGMAIVLDMGDKGLLTSGSVHRSGLITSSNLTNAIYALLEAPQVKPGNLSIAPFTDTLGPKDRINQLTRNNSIAMSVKDTEFWFVAILVVIMGLSFVISSLLLFMELRLKPAFLERLLPASRVLWIVALAIPVASYLMFIQLPTYTTPEIVLDYFLFTVMEVAFTCIIIALVFKWTHALLFVLGLTCTTLVVDQLIGGPMTATGYLSYAPIEVTRYYGIGNEGASFVFGSWITFSAILLNSHFSKRFNYHFKRWIFPLLTLCICVVLGAPWWGCNFGVIIWGTVGSIIAWAMFNGHEFSIRHTLFLTLFAAAAAFCVLVVDNTLNPNSHLGSYGSLVADGDFMAVIADVIHNVFMYSWDTIVFSPPLTVAFFAILAFMIFLLVRKPGSYALFWKSNFYFKGGYIALLVTACIMLVTEDSGIFMPALLLLYAFVGLLWLVCDSHSWHIRKWVADRIISDARYPVTPISSVGDNYDQD